jgi:alpha-glucosidase
MEKHSDEYRQDMFGNADNFFGAMHHNMSRMGAQAVDTAMNELSNHDHSRFLTRTNHIVGRTASVGPEKASEGVDRSVFMEAVVVQMTWMGAPTIYYGDEAGVCGWTDPDNRRTYPWGHEDKELIRFHQDVIKLHKEHRVFATGSYKPLLAEHNLIAYGRFNQDEAIVVVVNNSDDERRATIPVWEIGVSSKTDMEQIFATYDGGYSTQRLDYSVNDGWITIGLRRQSAIVLSKID